MDYQDYYNHGSWEVRCSKNYAFICCPVMNGLVSFSEQRKIYHDLKVLELDLQAQGKAEIAAYTSIYHPHIMLMFKKLDYTPFHLSLERKILWFKKELQNV